MSKFIEVTKCNNNEKRIFNVDFIVAIKEIQDDLHDKTANALIVINTTKAHVSFYVKETYDTLRKMLL